MRMGSAKLVAADFPSDVFLGFEREAGRDFEREPGMFIYKKIQKCRAGQTCFSGWNE